MKIYIVEGNTGEYDDYRCWPVHAYADETKAKEHADNAQNWLTDYGPERWRKERWDVAPKNPYDPNMYVDYTGTKYSVYSIECTL